MKKNKLDNLHFLKYLKMITIISVSYTHLRAYNIVYDYRLKLVTLQIETNKIKKRTMETPFYYYILCILAAVIAFLIVKKITSCMIKVVIAIVMLAVLALIYFRYIA